MCGIADQGQSSAAVIPRLCDPVADIGAVDEGVIGDPGKCRASGFAHVTGSLLDHVEALLVAEAVVGVPQPGHREMEDPGFWVVGTVRHAGDCRRNCVSRGSGVLILEVGYSTYWTERHGGISG